ncbi:hypothetical protein [Pseudorhodobacter turbinis]|uniref:hypothetical protein n=1 Tax=Pseudorhodobacter turbinis TaxID=2500533 RepID=UPI001F0F1248|nr:hypothetical protein [Pseudorhodobacter turbinis]
MRSRSIEMMFPFTGFCFRRDPLGNGFVSRARSASESPVGGAAPIVPDLAALVDFVWHSIASMKDET